MRGPVTRPSLVSTVIVTARYRAHKPLPDRYTATTALLLATAHYPRAKKSSAAWANTAEPRYSTSSSTSNFGWWFG